MKLLAVRGENLASLAAPFDVSFDDEPLKSSGLFAIVGPTGAGKSTLLDAICLALFDETPRLGGRARYAVGRSDDQENLLNASDPKTIVRRGASNAFAEVDFVGVDRKTYRARWQVKRKARGDLALRDQTRTLTRVEDDTVLGGRKNETQDAIHDALGLTFDQFRRAVLLAQGDFAAFLRANGNDRADLLERMTGTELYGEISKAAYRRGQAMLLTERDKLQLLEHLGGFDAEQRAAVQADVVAAEATLADKLLALQQANTAERWLRDAARLVNELAEAQQAGIDATERHAEADAARETFQQWLRAQPLRGAHEALLGANKAYATLQRELTIAQGESSNAQIEQRALATRVAAASATVQALRARADALGLPRQPTGETSAVSDEELRRCAAIDDTALRRMESSPGFATLVARWTEITDARTVATTERATITTIDRDLALLRREADDSATRRAAIESSRVAKAALVKDAEQASEVANGTVAAMPRAPAERDKAAAELRCRDWQRANDASDAVTSADAAIARTVVERDEIVASLRRAQRDDELATTELANACARVDEAARALSLLERSASLTEHRALLVDDEPCPLCGALDHPAAHVGALDSVIAQQAQVVAELRGVQRAAETVAKSSSGLVAQLGGRLQGSNNELARHREGRDDEDKILQQALRALDNGVIDIAAGLAAATSAQQAAVDRVAKAERALADARAATDVVLRERKALDGIATTLQSADTATAALATKIAALLQQRATCDAKADSAEQQIARVLVDAGHAEGGDFTELTARVVAWRSDAAAVSADLAILEHALTTWRLTLDASVARVAATQAIVGTLSSQRAASMATAEAAASAWHATLAAGGFAEADAHRLFAFDEAWAAAQRSALELLDADRAAAAVLIGERQRLLTVHCTRAPHRSLDDLDAALLDAVAITSAASTEVDGARAVLGELQGKIAADDLAGEKVADEKAALEQHRDEARPWLTLQEMIGSENGNRFRVFAQGLTLDRLLTSANRHLDEFAPRYRLERVRDNKNPLEIQVVDRDLGDDVRSVASLSGGEGFLVSLALALGLSSMSSHNVRIGTLLIDEGFGTLDPVSLEIALAALDALQSRGRQVGIISHVAGLIERLSAYVEIRPLGGSRSEVVVHGARSS